DRLQRPCPILENEALVLLLQDLVLEEGGGIRPRLLVLRALHAGFGDGRPDRLGIGGVLPGRLRLRLRITAWIGARALVRFAVNVRHAAPVLETAPLPLTPIPCNQMCPE